MRELQLSRVLSTLSHVVRADNAFAMERAIGVWVSRMLTRADIVMERRLP